MEQAARIAPDDPQVLAELAREKGKAGAVDEGISIALRAVRFEPGRPDFLLGLAALLAKAGRCDEAGVTGDRAVEVLPDGVADDVVALTKGTVATLRRDCRPAATPAAQ